jgi:DNA-binding MarR family transcriptional regulator
VPRTNRNTSPAEYRALSEFRSLIRRYLTNGEIAARSVGLEPQQYVSLLTMRGMPPGQQATIRSLADRLHIRHHSAVELVDRMEKRGLCRRERSKTDRRLVLLHVTPRGEKLLSRLVRYRIAELQETGPSLAHALGALLGPASRKHTSMNAEGVPAKRAASKRRRASRGTATTSAS